MHNLYHEARDRKQRTAKRCHNGFTLIELLVVIAIISLLAAILFPVFARARENARKTSCQSNLKQISIGFLQYNADNDGRFPQAWDLLPGKNPGTSDCTSPRGCVQTPTTLGVGSIDDPVVWPAKIEPYLKSRQIFNCPSATKIASSPCLAVGTNRDKPLAWRDGDPVVGSAISNWFLGASQVAYGYNAQYLGGGQFVAHLTIQHVKYPSATNCWTCGIPALESDLAQTSQTVLLAETTAANSGFDGAPAFAGIWDTWDAEGDYWCNDGGGAEAFDNFALRHNDGMNVAFTDGHVKWMRKKAVAYRAASFSAPNDPDYLWDR